MFTECGGGMDLDDCGVDEGFVVVELGGGQLEVLVSRLIYASNRRPSV